MNKILMTAVFLLSWAVAGMAQEPANTIAEVKQKTVVSAAPRECLLAFREFFRYLQHNQPDIVRDERAQKRFLCEYLRKIFVDHIATFANEKDSPDFPSNGTFLGAWDLPTNYAIAATRRYGKHAVIDVLYKWGPNTNYPGDERTTSFIFLLEDGAWKLDDIYTFSGKFVTAESLNQYLRAKR